MALLLPIGISGAPPFHNPAAFGMGRSDDIRLSSKSALRIAVILLILAYRPLGGQ
jgi:hypothetical protein